jgi:hypothetical protein
MPEDGGCEQARILARVNVGTTDAAVADVDNYLIHACVGDLGADHPDAAGTIDHRTTCALSHVRHI